MALIDPGEEASLPHVSSLTNQLDYFLLETPGFAGRRCQGCGLSVMMRVLVANLRQSWKTRTFFVHLIGPVLRLHTCVLVAATFLHSPDRGDIGCRAELEVRVYVRQALKVSGRLPGNVQCLRAGYMRATTIFSAVRPSFWNLPISSLRPSARQHAKHQRREASGK
jgi:hypothetical protein